MKSSSSSYGSPLSPTLISSILFHGQQVKQECANLESQTVHLKNARDQVEIDLKTQKETAEKMATKFEKTLATFKEKYTGSNEESTLQQKAFETLVYREATNNLLFTVGQLTNEFPELTNFFAIHLKKANMVVPSQVTVPRPLSARSDGSSGSKSHRSSSSSGGGRSVPVREFGFEL